MKKKCIICIFGNKDCGKTSSILELYKLLIEQGWLNAECPKTLSDDIYAVFEKSGITIGISSVGDPKTNQKELIERLINYTCDFIVCAARGYERSEPIKNINAIYKANNSIYNVIFLSNYSINDYNSHMEAANQLSKLTAKGILNVIEYVISKNGEI